MPFEIAMGRSVTTTAKTELMLRPVWIDDPVAPILPDVPTTTTVEHATTPAPTPFVPFPEPKPALTVEMPKRAQKWAPLLELEIPAEVPWCQLREGDEAAIRLPSAGEALLGLLRQKRVRRLGKTEVLQMTKAGLDFFKAGIEGSSDGQEVLLSIKHLMLCKQGKARFGAPDAYVAALCLPSACVCVAEVVRRDGSVTERTLDIIEFLTLQVFSTVCFWVPKHELGAALHYHILESLLPLWKLLITVADPLKTRAACCIVSTHLAPAEAPNQCEHPIVAASKLVFRTELDQVLTQAYQMWAIEPAKPGVDLELIRTRFEASLVWYRACFSTVVEGEHKCSGKAFVSSLCSWIEALRHCSSWSQWLERRELLRDMLATLAGMARGGKNACNRALGYIVSLCSLLPSDLEFSPLCFQALLAASTHEFLKRRNVKRCAKSILSYVFSNDLNSTTVGFINRCHGYLSRPTALLPPSELKRQGELLGFRSSPQELHLHILAAATSLSDIMQRVIETVFELKSRLLSDGSDRTIDMLHDAHDLCWKSVELQHPAVAVYIKNMVTIHVAAGDFSHAAAAMLAGWKLTVHELSSSPLCIPQLKLKGVPKEEILPCIDLLARGREVGAASALRSVVGIANGDHATTMAEPPTRRFYAVRVCRLDERFSCWYVYLPRQGENADAFAKHLKGQWPPEYAVDFFAAFLDDTSSDGQLFHMFSLDGDIASLIQLCTIEVHPTSRRRLQAPKKIVTIAPRLDLTMQWMGSTMKGLESVANAEGRYLEMALRDAFLGTCKSSMSLKDAHQFLDSRREDQAKENKKLQDKMRVKYVKTVQSLPEGEEKPPEPDYEEVWRRPSEVANQIEELVGGLTELRDVVLAHMGANLDELERRVAKAKEIAGETRAVFFEKDATNEEWASWQVVVDMVATAAPH